MKKYSKEMKKEFYKRELNAGLDFKSQKKLTLGQRAYRHCFIEDKPFVPKESYGNVVKKEDKIVFTKNIVKPVDNKEDSTGITYKSFFWKDDYDHLEKIKNFPYSEEKHHSRINLFRRRGVKDLKNGEFDLVVPFSDNLFPLHRNNFGMVQYQDKNGKWHTSESYNGFEMDVKGYGNYLRNLSEYLLKYGDGKFRVVQTDDPNFGYIKLNSEQFDLINNKLELSMYEKREKERSDFLESQRKQEELDKEFMREYDLKMQKKGL